METIRTIFEQTGFENIEVTRAGGVPLLWKIMVVRATRPAA